MTFLNNEQVPLDDQILLAEYFSNLYRLVSRRWMSTAEVIALYGSLSSQEHLQDLIDDIQLEEIAARGRGIEIPPRSNRLSNYFR